MASPSKYQEKLNFALKKRAFDIYKQGLPLRAVSAIVDKSHEWVRCAVKEMEELETVDNSDLTDSDE